MSKKIQLRKLVFMPLMALILFPIISQAELENETMDDHNNSEIPSSSIGLQLGVSTWQSDRALNLSYGLNMLFPITSRFKAGFLVGGAYLGSEAGTGVFSNGSRVNGTFSRHLLHFDGEASYTIWNGLWAGVRAGLGYISESFSSSIGATGRVGNSPLGFEVAPALGYDFKFNQSYSIGVDLSYYWIFFTESWQGFQSTVALKIYQ